jgi:hypothetical protein
VGSHYWVISKGIPVVIFPVRPEAPAWLPGYTCLLLLLLQCCCLMLWCPQPNLDGQVVTANHSRHSTVLLDPVVVGSSDKGMVWPGVAFVGGGADWHILLPPSQEHQAAAEAELDECMPCSIRPPLYDSPFHCWLLLLLWLAPLL